MNPKEITPEALPQLLKEATTRRQLLDAMRGEEDDSILLSDRVSEIAPQCVVTSAELDAIVDVLLLEDAHEDVLGDLLFNSAMSDQSLTKILEAGRCISALGHRSGPEWLLLRMAKEHKYPESILTLALVHYGPPGASEEKFLEFVRQYLHVEWLRQSIRKSHGARHTMEPHKRAAALRMIEAYEREHQL